MLRLSVKNQKSVVPTYLSLDEEAYVFSEEEIESAHGLSIDTVTIAYELQCVVKSVK